MGQTIEGVRGYSPVGAVLSIGVKAISLPDTDPLFQSHPKLRGKDSPVYTDRFYIVSRYEDDRRIRPQLGEFVRFNTAPKEARQVMHGVFVHASIAEVLASGLAAQKLPNHQPGNPKGGRPACSSDGITATRFAGLVDGAETWRELPCPNRLCEYRQTKPAPCKSSSKLYFMPRWGHFKGADFHGPTPLIRWPTHAWENAENLIGFFDYVSRQAEQLGVIPMRDPASLVYNPLTPIFGLPFSLRLSVKTNRAEGHKWPVVAITPECNLIEFLMAQRERLRAIGAGGDGTLQLHSGGALDPAEAEPEELIADRRMLTPGVPGVAVAVVPEGDAVEAEVVAAADREQEYVEAKLEAIGRELDRLCPGRNSEGNRAVIRFSCFGVRTDAQMRRLSLDALTAGLEQMQAAR